MVSLITKHFKLPKSLTRRARNLIRMSFPAEKMFQKTAPLLNVRDTKDTRAIKEYVRKYEKGLQTLRRENGAFVAAPSNEYSACWMRDQLYANFAYLFLGDTQKFREGVWVVFDILHKHKRKIEKAVMNPPRETHHYIHAKFHAETLDEITNDWGHHQLDAIGLFLYMAALAHKKNTGIFRNGKDLELLQLLVAYLTAVRYWDTADNGMWEEGMDLHASSIGACVAGLSLLQKEELAVVPDSLIHAGIEALYHLLPNETPTRDVDMAQLSLIWPYKVVSDDLAEIIIRRVEEKLIQEKGVNRYWDDNYYRSENGVSAEWTMGFFWLSLIESARGNKRKAHMWFNRGILTETEDGLLPELYCNNTPNGNTPLAWSHSLAIIAGLHLIH